jgi:hypothetical protein
VSQRNTGYRYFPEFSRHCDNSPSEDEGYNLEEQIFWFIKMENSTAAYIRLEVYTYQTILDYGIITQTTICAVN